MLKQRRERVTGTVHDADRRSPLPRRPDARRWATAFAVRGYRRHKALPILHGAYGCPTAILVNRNGRVFSIHTGFAGPATGRHYEKHVKEFRDQVEQLLAPPAAG